MAKEQENANEDRWVLDKHIPLAIVIGLVIQTGTWIWWAAYFSASTNSRLETLEAHRKITAQLPERMARQEVLQEQMNALLKEIRDDLRQQKSGRLHKEE